MPGKGREEKERKRKGLTWVLVSALPMGDLGHIFWFVIKP